MKKLLCVIMSVFTFGISFAQTADEILDKMRGQRDVKTVAAIAEIVVEENGKTTNVLGIRQFTSKDKAGLQRTMVEFTSGNQKGNRFLMNELKDGTTDQRVYLQGLGKVRRINASAGGNESFFGTDFTYNDMSFVDRSEKLDTYTRLDDEKYKGKDCYVLQAVPNDSDYVYAKTILRVEKATNLLLMAEFYNAEGTKVKEIELFNYEDVTGIKTPKGMKMTTLAKNSSTTIAIKKIFYDQKLPESIFTNKYLETGRR